MYLSWSTKKYSCSAPTIHSTFLTSFVPNSFKILFTSLSKASHDFKSGVFLSKACPPYEQNTVGIQSTAPDASSLIKAFDVQSHAV